MQTVYLDISRPSIVAPIYAKQDDVGRVFSIRVTENGAPFDISETDAVTVWYEGASGSGNYAEIGNRDAVRVEDGFVIVEMIPQMVSVPGEGKLCITINNANGNQIGLWNIPYIVEGKPGHDSGEVEYYYQAFADTVTRLYAIAYRLNIDPTLAISGSAADAKVTGDKISVLNSRIDNLFKAPTGSTTMDAEILDARIDYEGVEHGSLGDHLRHIDKEQSTNYLVLFDQLADIESQLSKIAFNDKIMSDICGWTSKSIVERLSPKKFSYNDKTIVNCHPIEASHIDIKSSVYEDQKIYQSGKNLLGAAYWGQHTFYMSNGEERKRYGYLLRLPAATYTLRADMKGEQDNDFMFAYVVDKDNKYKQYINLAGTTWTVTLADGDRILVVNGRNQGESNATTMFGRYNTQVEFGDEATNFEEPIGYKYDYEGSLTPLYGLKGINYIWGDTGTISVTGYEDVAVVNERLESRIAALEAAVNNA